jgi:hypothetical protein
VVQACQGLQRLLLRFPNAFVPGIKVFEASAEGDRTNLSMGFALYDHRVGPTPEEERVLQNIDALALFLRSNIIKCDRIRRTLKLGPDSMTAPQQQVAVEMMDLHVARPAATPMDAVGRPRALDGDGASSSGGAVPSRYCYVKLVAPDPAVSEKYHTYFWTADGRRIPFETVVAYRNFHVIPLVEPEDIFVSKAVRSVQLKLREAIVIPPAERMLQRVSAFFPDRVCRIKCDKEPVVVVVPDIASHESPSAVPGDAKRARHESPPVLGDVDAKRARPDSPPVPGDGDESVDEPAEY